MADDDFKPIEKTESSAVAQATESSLSSSVGDSNKDYFAAKNSSERSAGSSNSKSSEAAAIVDKDAEYLKVPDRNTGVIPKEGQARVDKPALPPKGDAGPAKISDYTGGKDITPETKEIRQKHEAENAAAQKARDAREVEDILRRSSRRRPGEY